MCLVLFRVVLDIFFVRTKVQEGPARETLQASWRHLSKRSVQRHQVARLTSRRDSTMERIRCHSRWSSPGVLCGAAWRGYPLDHRQREERQAMRLAGWTLSRWEGRALQRRCRQRSWEGRLRRPETYTCWHMCVGECVSRATDGARARQHWR